MSNKRVFVTVGTTKFEELTKTVSQPDILRLLQKLGYVEVQFQTGDANFENISYPGMTLNHEPYFENFGEQIDISNLIISHAGAGTCLEVLHHGKPLIAVVNDSLMDNHQVELAEQLQHSGYLFFCTCISLKETLQKNLKLLKKYPAPNESSFTSYIDKCMGFQ